MPHPHSASSGSGAVFSRGRASDVNRACCARCDWRLRENMGRSWMGRSLRRIIGVAMMMLLAWATHAEAQPRELKLATFGPPQSYFYVEVLIPWLQAVSRDSEGTLDIKYFG